MPEQNMIREAWYTMQRYISEQDHPIWAGETLYPIDKLPITTEDKWTIERLRVESDIEALLEDMDVKDGSVQSETKWRKEIRPRTIKYVTNFRGEKARLLAEGHVDDREYDPDLVTDGELGEQIDAMAARKAELEAQLESGQGDHADLMATVDALQRRIDALEKNRAELAASTASKTDCSDLEEKMGAEINDLKGAIRELWASTEGEQSLGKTHAAAGAAAGVDSWLWLWMLGGSAVLGFLIATSWWGWG